MSEDAELLWIVFDGKEPSTAHRTLDEAKIAAQWAIDRGHIGAGYSIWSARLTHSMDKGIPIHPTALAEKGIPGLATRD
jgi:hypothetical protein